MLLDMVCRLLSNVCVVTSFYQRPASRVYSFASFNLRNLLYLISVLFHKAENGELEPFAGDICGFMTADRIDHSFYHEDDPSSYYLGDVHYDHGDCELIDSSVQPIETILGYSD